MKTLRSPIRSGIIGLCLGGLAVSQSIAMPLTTQDVSRPVVLVAADCYAIGQQVAEENGGTLAKASPSEQNGQAVCVIVVLVPGKDGQRPRRAEYVVPQN